MESRDRTGRTGVDGPIPPEEVDPGAFSWIVDGHNAIFSVRAWEDLQVCGRRREARRALEESLEAFGRAAGCRMTVVFDGNRIDADPDSVDWPHLRTVYSHPPEEADDRIRYLADRALKDGLRPVVVTSDRRTLAASLPPGIRTVSVKRFFGRIHARLLQRPEKWDPEEMEDVERHFLRQSPFPEDRLLAEDGDPPADGTEGTEPPERT